MSIFPMSLNTLQKQHFRMLENFPSYGYTLIYLTIALLLDILVVWGIFVCICSTSTYTFVHNLWVSTYTKRRLLEEENELPFRPVIHIFNLLSRESVPICPATKMPVSIHSPNSC